MKHIATIELDFDPIYIVCEVEYYLAKSYQPHAFGERILIDIEDIRLFVPTEVRIDFFGVDVPLTVTEEVTNKIKRQIELETENIKEQIIGQLEPV